MTDRCRPSDRNDQIVWLPAIATTTSAVEGTKRTSHGDESFTSTPGAVVSSQFTVFAADIVDGADHVLLPGAGDGRHGFGFEIDPAQGVVDGVGDDDPVPDLRRRGRRAAR
jgi:hypothetical protein